MKQFILALFCLGAVSSVYGRDGGFRVRFGVELGFGNEYFVAMPQTSSEALAAEWTPERRADADFLPFLIQWCHPTKVLCVLMDDTGYAAGLQVAILVEEFKEVFDLTVQGFVKWTPSDGKTYWATQQYFVDEDFLAIPAADRIAKRDPKKFLQANGVWVRGYNGKIDHIGKTIDEIYAAGFTKQACMPFMGLHQYMEMTENTPCKADTFYPFFTLTHDDELIATGLEIFGVYPQKDKEFFERPSRSAVKTIVPRGPECLYDLAENPGLITIHIYYIDRPRTILCSPF